MPLCAFFSFIHGFASRVSLVLHPSSRICHTRQLSRFGVHASLEIGPLSFPSGPALYNLVLAMRSSRLGPIIPRERRSALKVRAGKCSMGAITLVR